MTDICSRCPSRQFATGELREGDAELRQAVHLLAARIRVIAALYAYGILQKPEGYAFPDPDLLAFQHAPRPIEQRLFVLHFKHCMRTLQRAFHANPDYARWNGCSETVGDFAEIQAMAAALHAQRGN